MALSKVQKTSTKWSHAASCAHAGLLRRSRINISHRIVVTMLYRDLVSKEENHQKERAKENKPNRETRKRAQQCLEQIYLFTYTNIQIYLYIHKNL